MILCKLCGKEFADRRVFGIHLSRSEKDKFASDLDKERYLVDTLFGRESVDNAIAQYKAEKICTYELSKSIDIVKLIFLMGIKRSSKEERKTARYKERYLNALQKKFGAGIVNVSQVKEVQEKKKKTLSKSYLSYNDYLASCRKQMKIGYDHYILDKNRVARTVSKIESTCLEKYGHKNFGAGEIAKEKSKISRRETIAQWGYEERLSRTSIARASVCSRGGYSSKPEKRVQQCLTELDIEFTANVHLWNYNYDIVFGNTIIEVQGDMWHANPSKYKATDLIMGKLLSSDIWAKDARKKAKAEDNGYMLLTIWEHDISIRNTEQLIQFIKELVCL